MILDVDIGNSAIKWRFIDQNITVEGGRISHQQDAWGPLIDHCYQIERVRISNVGGVELGVKLSQWLFNKLGIYSEFAISKVRSAGVINGYRDPETLGVDRWLAVVAAGNMLAGPCLVVDAGSALTIDFVTANGQHQGGYIVPGANMMFDALYGGTADVRFEPGKKVTQLPGQSTALAVQNGCFAMTVALIEKGHSIIEGTEGAATIVLTGGGSPPLVNCLDPSKVRHIPDLVLEGLAFVLP